MTFKELKEELLFCISHGDTESDHSRADEVLIAIALNITFTLREDDLLLFENAIDKLRFGHPRRLGEFYGIFDHTFEYNMCWNINNNNYLEELPSVQKYCNELKELGY